MGEKVFGQQKKRAWNFFQPRQQDHHGLREQS
jgi:hypothetical protein